MQLGLGVGTVGRRAQVDVSVDEPGDDVTSTQVDHDRVAWGGRSRKQLTAASDRHDAVAPDADCRVHDGWPAQPVDQGEPVIDLERCVRDDLGRGGLTQAEHGQEN